MLTLRNMNASVNDNSFFAHCYQGIIVKVHLQVSLSQVIDKSHRSVRNGIVLHDISDILLDISARSDLDHPVCIQGHSPDCGIVLDIGIRSTVLASWPYLCPHIIPEG